MALTRRWARRIFMPMSRFTLLMQTAQGAVLLGEQQEPAGVAIEPVHQLQVVLRPQRAQRFDRTEGHAAAAVRGQPARLVEYQ